MTLILLLVGLVALYYGAEWLVRGAVTVARRLGISPLVIGLTIVAAGTSAPELTVSLQSALIGSGDIAVANVIGSNIFNTAAILGLVALICPIPINSSIVRVDLPVMIAVSVLILWILLDRQVARLEGVLLVAGAVSYIGWTIWRSRSRPADDPLVEEAEESIQRWSDSWIAALVFIAGGLLTLVLGSKALIFSSIQIARHFGVSEAVIGLTIVSAGTSLPELATSLVAGFRKQPDIAVGNVVGSNIFNILVILGLTATVSPCSSPGITAVDGLTMLGLAVITLPFMWTRFTLARWEGGILLATYVGYLAWLLHVTLQSGPAVS